MTSKEALKHIKNAPSFMGGDDRYNDCLNSSNDSQSLDKIKQILNSQQLYLKDINQIERDLEVLEILKRNLYIEQGVGKFKGIEIIQCSLGNQHSEDFNKIKGWLGNDK